MKKDYLNGNDFVSTVSGGALKEFNADGDYVTDVPVPPGRHRVSRFMVGIGRRHTLRPGADVVCFPPDQRHSPSDFGSMQYETAASQNFQLDRADREKRRNDRLERLLDAQGRRQALLERALTRSRGSEPDSESETSKVGEDEKPA